VKHQEFEEMEAQFSQAQKDAQAARELAAIKEAEAKQAVADKEKKEEERKQAVADKEKEEAERKQAVDAKLAAEKKIADMKDAKAKEEQKLEALKKAILREPWCNFGSRGTISSATALVDNMTNNMPLTALSKADRVVCWKGSSNMRQVITLGITAACVQGLVVLDANGTELYCSGGTDYRVEGAFCYTVNSQRQSASWTMKNSNDYKRNVNRDLDGITLEQAILEQDWCNFNRQGTIPSAADVVAKIKQQSLSHRADRVVCWKGASLARDIVTLGINTGCVQGFSVLDANDHVIYDFGFTSEYRVKGSWCYTVNSKGRSHHWEMARDSDYTRPIPSMTTTMGLRKAIEEGGFWCNFNARGLIGSAAAMAATIAQKNLFDRAHRVVCWKGASIAGHVFTLGLRAGAVQGFIVLDSNGNEIGTEGDASYRVQGSWCYTIDKFGKSYSWEMADVNDFKRDIP